MATRNSSKLTKAISYSVAGVLLVATVFSIHQLLLIGIAQWKEPVLSGDSWRFLTRGSEGTTKWLFAQHNEHRIVIAKISTLIETELLHIAPTQSAIYQSTAILLLCCSTWYFLVSTITKSREIKLVGTLAGSALLLNPWQHENFDWEFQTPWLFINLLTLISAFLLSNIFNEKKNLKITVVAFIVIPWIAIFSTGQGIALGLALWLCSLLCNKKLSLVCGISLLFALITNFWFLSYKSLAGAGHPEYNFDVFYFFKVATGGSWDALGILLIAGAVAFLITYKYIPKSQMAYVLLPGIFSILFSLMTTISRSGFGIDQANTSRYISHSSMLAISSLLIIIIHSDRYKSSWRNYLPGLLVILILTTSSPFNFKNNGPSFKEKWQDAQNAAKNRRDDFSCLKSKIYELNQNNLSNISCNERPHYNDIGTDYFNNRTTVKPTGWHLENNKIRIK